MERPLPDYSQYANYIITSPSEAVIQVQVNRPDSFNTFTDGMWKSLGHIFRHISQDPDYRVVVLSAGGKRGFTAGLDLHEASQGDILRGVTNEDPGRRATKIRRYIEQFQAQLTEIELCAKPVICALFGVSYGIGVDIACCCDVRICSEDTVFAVKEIDVGIAADLGTLTRLPKVVGSFSSAKYVCLTGAAFKATEALHQGFVTHVFSSRDKCLEEAQKQAALIASKSPVATTGVKAIMNHAKDHTISQSLHYTAVLNSAALQTEDVSKAIMSFKTRKVPSFAKL